ncbi:carboxylating nicotinate-nucleotide diphosphorylase [Candidatus Omnitrophota bacterium]
MKLSKEKILPVIMSALREDVATGDITSGLVFEKDINVMADIIVKEECVLAGLDVARWVFNAMDERIIFNPLYKDGERPKKGKKIISLRGSAKNILSGERVALNFLGRVSGIATLTEEFVKKVKTKGVEILDTRKTTPGMRELEKYAVRMGGGTNHRMGLWDSILIKDNHLEGVQRVAGYTSSLRAIKDTVGKAKSKGCKNVEIEVNNLKEYNEALEADADIIMLDNMKIEDIRKAVRLNKSRSKGRGSRSVLEASGNVTLENIQSLAKTGVDRISIGSLTHSAPSIDFSLEIR